MKQKDDPKTAVEETIAAVATPPGRGGVGIIRVSGPLVSVVADTILGKLPLPRLAEYLTFKDNTGQMIDTGLAIYFPNPHSFTGEDVLELHGHGGPVVLDMLLRSVLKLGVRAAQPGEFSQRAFLNNKIDLAQAEAIADLIDAASEQAARMALRSLQGEFSTLVNQLVEQLIQLRLLVESVIDFPEEEIDFLADEQLNKNLQQILSQLRTTLKCARQGSILREGIHVVITGRPNAGKSTLLNQLTGLDSAIVTDIPGTTRDVLREQIQMDGLPLHIIDTAGLREEIGDEVEREGIRRAWREIERADQILYVLDDQQGMTTADRALLARLSGIGPGATWVHNKIDLSRQHPRIEHHDAKTHIYLSAKSGRGVELLRAHLKQIVGYQAVGEGGFMARRRHIDALERAKQSVQTGIAHLLLNSAGELLAEELRQAQQALSEITGEFSADELLGRIFSSFCIGK